jgi:hypothetical protein
MATGYTPRMISEEIRRRFAGGNPDDDFQIENEDLYVALDMAMSYLYARYWLEQATSQVLGSHLRQVSITPSHSDSMCGRIYWFYDLSDLGFKLLQLPLDRGVWQITDGRGTGYSPEAPDFIYRFSNLDAFNILPNCPYWTVGTKLYFGRKPSCEVTLHCVPSCWGEIDTTIAIPVGYADEVIKMTYSHIKIMAHTVDVDSDSSNATQL